MVDPKYYRLDYEHILPHFIEECGEAMSAAGKTLRWGLDSYNPDLPEDQRELNIDWLSREIFDVIKVSMDLHRVLKHVKNQLTEEAQKTIHRGS